LRINYPKSRIYRFLAAISKV